MFLIENTWEAQMFAGNRRNLHSPAENRRLVFAPSSTSLQKKSRKPNRDGAELSKNLGKLSEI